MFSLWAVVQVLWVWNRILEQLEYECPLDIRAHKRLRSALLIVSNAKDLSSVQVPVVVLVLEIQGIFP